MLTILPLLLSLGHNKKSPCFRKACKLMWLKTFTFLLEFFFGHVLLKVQERKLSSLDSTNSQRGNSGSFRLKMSSHEWEPIARVYDPLKAGSIDGTDTLPHDHGIVRAMEAEYKPNKLVVGDPKATIFVGRLNPETTEETLRKVFSQCGEIKRMRLVRDIVTGFSRRYAFVEFHDRYDAVKAERDMNKALVDGREIYVDGECERLLSGWVPRRLGGGLSGKKESGQLRFGGKERPFKKPLQLFKVTEYKGKRQNFYENSYRGFHSGRQYDGFREKRDHRQERERHSYRRRDSER